MESDNLSEGVKSGTEEVAEREDNDDVVIDENWGEKEDVMMDDKNEREEEEGVVDKSEEKEGSLGEGKRQNILRPSRQLSQSMWSKCNFSKNNTILNGPSAES